MKYAMRNEQIGGKKTLISLSTYFFPYKQKYNSDLKSRIALEEASNVFK